MKAGAHCSECPLKDQPYCPGAGSLSPKLVLVGEAPGYQEARDGVPFVGNSGKLLWSLLKSLGVTREDCYVTNAVLCRPPNNREPTKVELGCCYPALKKVLDRFSDVPTVALGRTAMDALGVPHNLRGYWHGNKLGAWHPAYILRRPNEIGELHNQLWKALNTQPLKPLDPEIVVIDTFDKLDEFLANKVEDDVPVCVDLETTQVNWQSELVLCMGVAWSAERAYIITDRILYSRPAATQLAQWFEGKYIGGHNFKFDQNFMAHHLDLHLKCRWDTFLMHYCTKETSGGHGLKELAAFYFDAPDYEAELVQKYLKSRNDDYSKVPQEKLHKYCGLDVCYNWRLFWPLRDELRDSGLSNLHERLVRYSNALHIAEQRGVRVDLEQLTNFINRMDKECEKHVGWMRKCKEIEVRKLFDKGNAIDPDSELAWALDMWGKRDFNPNSWRQVGVVLFDLLGLPTKTAPRKKPRSTDKEVLKNLEGKHPFVDQLRQYRKKNKMRNTYAKNLVEGADDDGRVHPEFKVAGTVSGRLASFYHTIPRPGDPTDELSHLGSYIRQSFIASPGYKIIACDYSQAELRVAAARSGEEFLINAYAEGLDVHGEAATEVFGPNWTKEDRVKTKMMVFSFLYGGTEFSMSNEYEMPLDEARSVVRKFIRAMPTLAEYRDRMWRTMREQGYVETRFGRRRRFPLITQHNREDARKASMNMPIQSEANDITVESFCRLTEEGYDTLLTVHDSVILEAPEQCAEEVGEYVKQVMEETARKHFPEVVWKADVDIFDRWGE